MTDLPLKFGPGIGENDFQRIHRRMGLEFFKWDSQIGDCGTLFRQPLLLNAATWQELKRTAENLTAELMVAEEALLHRPDLYSVLGLSRALRSLFRHAQRARSAPCALRTLRFDFHYTTQGWRISEVNSDVPGGYTEASNFTEMMAERYPSTCVSGNPAAEWASTMVSAVGERGHVALLSAPGFLEDQQVTAFLAHQLESRDVGTSLLHNPSQLLWTGERAFVLAQGKQLELRAIVRFYQGEWLARLPDKCGWQLLVSGGKTAVTNPGTALLTESKRFPLTWNKLPNKMNTWQALLPECRDPEDNCWKTDDSWILKAAFSNTGDDVYVRELTDGETWTKLCRLVKKYPETWVVQRRFETMPVLSNVGAVYPCIGVYTINGRAAGVYARASVRPITDYAAMDVALLIDERTNAQQG